MITAAGCSGRMRCRRTAIDAGDSSAARRVASDVDGAPFTTTTTRPAIGTCARSSPLPGRSRPNPANTMAPSACRRMGGRSGPSSSSGRSPVSVWVSPCESRRMNRVPLPTVVRVNGIRWMYPLSPAGLSPVAAARLARNSAARRSSGVPVSLPRNESDAKTRRSRRNSTAPGGTGSGASRLGGATVAGGPHATVSARPGPTRRTGDHRITLRRTTGQDRNGELQPGGMPVACRPGRCTSQAIPPTGYKIERGQRKLHAHMIYIAIPVFNEAPTIGVELWRIRKVFQDFPRDYELLVYDDASTDATPDVIQPYTEVLPLSVTRGSSHIGYGGALDALCRMAATRTRYARRDALVIMQGDFTDQPEHIPELTKRFEGGADVVVAERPATSTSPPSVRRLQRIAPW